MTRRPVHVVRVVLGPSKNGSRNVRLADSDRTSRYLDDEAPSSGVCMALEQVRDAVGCGELAADEGLLVRVDIQYEPKGLP